MKKRKKGRGLEKGKRKRLRKQERVSSSIYCVWACVLCVVYSKILHKSMTFILIILNNVV